MCFRSILKLSLVLVVVQSKQSNFKVNDDPIHARSANSDEKVANFCEEHYIDSAFSNENNQIRMTRKDWIWTFNEIDKKLESPQKQNPIETFLFQSKVYISNVPKCNSSDKICTDMRSIQDLIIILYKERNSEFSGNYQVRKVVNGILTNIDDTAILPFGLERSGNIFSSGQLFWPKELSLYEKQYRKKYTAMVYSPKNYDFVVIVNGLTKEYTKACFNRFDLEKEWTNTWNCKTIDHSWVYIGMFLMNKNIYVIGGKNVNSRVFIYADNELRDTELNIQQYLGCDENPRDFVQQNDENDSSESTTLVIIIGGIFLVIIVFTVIVFIIIHCLKKSKAKPKTEKPDMRPKATLRPIDKTNDVAEDQIGALSSKLDWNMKVSEISTLSGTPMDMNDNPEDKRVPLKKT